MRVIFRDGRSAVPKYEAKALNDVWASERGHLYAQMEIAEFYYSGTGVPVNYEKAFEWGTKASRRRDATPEYAL
ncbi:hypothetical protein BGZ91_012348 [Linnemannia elongata]|nr:hypothetical protein BGZ91_012348 [Linnemannia elongata]